MFYAKILEDLRLSVILQKKIALSIMENAIYYYYFTLRRPV